MPGTPGDRPSDRFVNPYTFVSFPQKIETAAPAGHASLARIRREDPERFSGSFEVTITAHSPLLIRNVYADGDPAPARVFEGRFDGKRVPYLPGSSLAGAVRSLHETIAGGCLRVFHGDFRPGYRDRVVARSHDWRMARVTEVDADGRPTRLNVCDEDTIRIDHAALLEAFHEIAPKTVLPTSGTLVQATGSGAAGGLVTRASDLTIVRGQPPAGSWAVLITDTRTRQGKPTRPGRARWTAGRLGGSRTVAMDSAVWQKYLDAVAGSDDVVKKRSETTMTVQHLGAAVGKRHVARRQIAETQMVWVDCELVGPDKVEVYEIALSTVWRHSPVDTAADRVPDVACTDPADLCPSCRVFGSVDATGSGSVAEQAAYRGHVRFGDGVPMKAYPFRRRDLPPLGQPRPGAGQFYLDPTTEGSHTQVSNGTPLREWGSGADEPTRRNFRGRKRYWLTGDPSSRQYFRATAGKGFRIDEAAGRDNARKMFVRDAPTIPERSRFRATVTFDALTLAEIGSLACSLDPGLLFGEPTGVGRHGSSIGGGQPLGFGTVTTMIEALTAQSAGARYLAEPEPATTLDEAVAVFLGALNLDDTRRTQLDHVLRLGFVPDDRVWYPPSAALDEGADLLTKDQVAALLTPGFTFWGETDGGKFQELGRPLRHLPLAQVPAEEQEMEIITEKRRPPATGHPKTRYRR